MATNTNSIESKLGIHLPTAPTDKEKYSYILKNSWFLKFLFVCEIVSLTRVYFGHIAFFENGIFYWVFLFGLATYLYVFQLISVGINLGYKEFDLQKHDKFIEEFWNKNEKKYRIDIFLPICGEDLAVLKNTWSGVCNLNSEKYEFNSFVMDDADDPEAKKLAESFGFTYWVRPNRGEMKKAGNLKYGFYKTSGDFIIIFDADFVPRHDFVKETLPYMIDSKYGIVQTPQYFDHNHKLHSESILESGAGNVQEYFYKIIQPGRESLDGAICVGSCAMYKREALDIIGGTAQVEHSEDVITGFRLLAKGWKLKYLPLPLSKGVCPRDLHAFFKQQTRWCSGSMWLMRSKEFWFANLPFYTKLCFISGFMFYISNPLSLILLFQSFMVLYFDANTIDVGLFYLFLPSILITFLIQFFYVYSNPKIGTILAHASAFWFYSYTVFVLLFGFVEGWAPTGGKQKLSNGFVFTVFASSTFIFLYCLSIFSIFYFSKINFFNQGIIPLVFIIFMILIYHLIFWLYSISHLNENHRESLPWYITEQKWLLPFVVYITILVLVWGFTPGLIGENKVAIADSPNIVEVASSTK
jgi:cellulose synthase (UDP-forming)